MFWDLNSGGEAVFWDLNPVALLWSPCPYHTTLSLCTVLFSRIFGNHNGKAPYSGPGTTLCSYVDSARFLQLCLGDAQFVKEDVDAQNE